MAISHGYLCTIQVPDVNHHGGVDFHNATCRNEVVTIHLALGY